MRNDFNDIRKFVALMVIGSVIAGGSVMIFSTNGCNGTMPETKEQSYLKARQVFNGILMDYVDQKRQADADTKARWTSDIDPWFERADKALDAWGDALESGGSGEGQQTLYLEIKSKLLNMMLNL
jgi:hypothetical protein